MLGEVYCPGQVKNILRLGLGELNAHTTLEESGCAVALSMEQF